MEPCEFFEVDQREDDDFSASARGLDIFAHGGSVLLRQIDGQQREEFVGEGAPYVVLGSETLDALAVAWLRYRRVLCCGQATRQPCARLG